MSSTWFTVGQLADIPRLGAKVVHWQGTPIAIFRTQKDEVFALEDHCPHKKGPLSQGIVHDRKVTCPLHGWVIELDRGTAIAPDTGCTPTFAVRVTEGRVELAVPHLDALATA
ncbi:nitrite reductase small subunit NirD [Halothiobacillus sp.]|jgi:nitrite reductase (NADH) small subunit|uniref:nitrite reductase small subunit NirD n=1 Tax=Halothiobacillus sp. TaxID=1891311 RepID=UPI002986CA84|nr:nitrite reductase small subunit NirD [Halothiobacillus sp.]